MRKAARILGLIIVSLIAAIYLLIIVGSLFDEEAINLKPEGIGMAILSLLTVVSAILAWVRTRIGLWMVLATGILFTIFALITAGSHHFIAVMGAGGPLIISGLLIFWGSYQKNPVKKD